MSKVEEDLRISHQTFVTLTTSDTQFVRIVRGNHKHVNPDTQDNTEGMNSKIG